MTATAFKAKPAVFSATYSDWRVIKGRKVVQIVFELPLESSDEAYQVLGGMPIAAREKWFGIARLNLTKTAAEKTKRSFNDLPEPQQAGILCNEPAFWRFLRERDPNLWYRCRRVDGKWLEYPDAAASVVRELCKVSSRAEITSKNVEWSTLLLSYRVWQKAAEVVPE
jgi:hypothetical protein